MVNYRANKRRLARSRRGLFLLMVVTTLAIVSLLAYQLATLSLNSAGRSVQAEKDLRLHWSLVSLRRTVLHQASSVLTIQERQLNIGAGTAPTVQNNAIYLSSFEDSLTLNGLRFTLSVRDESARLHFPNLVRTKSSEIAETTIERLQGVRGMRVRLNERLKEQVTLSWPDVFENFDTSNESLLAATQRLTLWGSGRLNLLRADDETVNEAWKAVFGHFPPGELRAARESYPPITWQQLKERLDLREEQAVLAERWLTTQSSCFSLRIQCQPNSHSTRDQAQSVSRYLFVQDRSSEYFGYQE